MIDTSPTTPTEIRGWNCFGFASEGFYGLGMAVFFPLILQELSNKVASTDDSIALGAPAPCDESIENYSCSINILGLWINTTSFVFYLTTLSVLVQFFVFLSLGAVADHGNYRKFFLIFFALLTAILGICTLFVVNASLLWLAAFIFVFSNVCYAASYVFCYAWVPLLTRFHPDVIKARSQNLSVEEFLKVSDMVSNQISSGGFMWSYIGSVIVITIGAGIAMLIGPGDKFGLPKTYSLNIGIAFACVWMIVFLLPTMRWLKPRPGPPLPPGQNYIIYSFKKFGHTFAKARQLSNLFLFLIGWFIYSDSFTTITYVAILYFDTRLHVEQSHLILAAIITPLFGGIGSFVWMYAQRITGAKTKTMLMLQATMYALLCIYGLLGFFTEPGTWGLRSKIEIFPLAAYHGFLLGSTQSSCRVLFSELVPPGLESEMFSLYEITDKGSSWIGPLVTGLIGNITGDQRNTFYFLLAMTVFPMFLFWFTDMEKGKQQAHEYVMNHMPADKNISSVAPGDDIVLTDLASDIKKPVGGIQDA